MRKMCLVLMMCILLTTASACTALGNRQIPVASAGYSCKAAITYGDLTAAATLEVPGGGIFRMTLIEPAVLDGLCFSFDGGQMSISYGHLTTTNLLTAEYGGFAALLNGVFLKLTSDQPVAIWSGEAFGLSGMTEGQSFSVLCNAQGLPTKITVPRAGLTAILTDWNYER